MSEFDKLRMALVKLRMALVNKINECGGDHAKIDLVVESFIDAIEACGWSTDDQLELLNATQNFFQTGYVKEKLLHEIDFIKVDNGY